MAGVVYVVGKQSMWLLWFELLPVVFIFFCSLSTTSTGTGLAWLCLELSSIAWLLSWYGMLVCRRFHHAFFSLARLFCFALFFVNYVAPCVQLFLHMDILRINKSTRALSLSLSLCLFARPSYCCPKKTTTRQHNTTRTNKQARDCFLIFTARTFYFSFFYYLNILYIIIWLIFAH